jgi:hypothetical protein
MVAPVTQLQQTHPPAARVAGYALFTLMMFGLGALATFAWNNRQLINDLYYEASEQRYQILSGEAGPVTYLAYHDDFAALEEMARQREDIIGVEIYEFPAVAAIAFSSNETPAIDEVRNLSSVDKLLRKQVPMLCH